MAINVSPRPLHLTDQVPPADLRPAGPEPVDVTIVVPTRHEAGNVCELVSRLQRVLPDRNVEILFVDDSDDDTPVAIARAGRASSRPVACVHRRPEERDGGLGGAVVAGLCASRAKWVAVMDGDLQHPPEVIPELVARWLEGYEVVYGVMTARAGETWFKRATAGLYYRLLRRLTDIDVPLSAGDFRLIDRKAVDAFLSMRERARYVRGMFSWIGFRQTGVAYDAPARVAGRSKYTFSRMVRLAKNGIFSFSNVPLRLVLTLGFVVSALAIVETVYALIGRFGGFYTVPGWTSIVIAVSFLGGVQLIVLGVIGEYVGLIYDEVKRRPIYLVRELHGFEPGSEP